MTVPTSELHHNTTSRLVTAVCERLSPQLRSLLLFGSYLSNETRRQGSIPDLFALVDDLDESLIRLGSGRLARRVSPFLPPTTLAFSASGIFAKLNLIEPQTLSHAIKTLPDLYLAGRLSK